MSEYAEEVNRDRDNESTFQPRINEVAQKFLHDLDKERERLGDDFPLINMLVEEATERVHTSGRIPGKEFYADVYKQKPLKITQKVFVPVKQYPKFNFTGKILGPKGNSLRRLQEETQCRITIKGRSSIRDRNKEEDLRNSGEPRYAHLNKDLFLEITAVSTPAECYARVAYALAEIRKYLVPDKNDDISHEQLRELMEIDPQSVKIVNNAPQVSKSVFDKKISSKYQGFLKSDEHSHDDSSREDAKDSDTEYERYSTKRDPPVEYDCVKARGLPSSYKRAPVGGNAPDMKRLRESSVACSSISKGATYKPSPYAVLKKYK